MKNLSTRILAIASFVMLLMALSAPASALDLDTARRNGLAGEVDNGLLAVPPGAAQDATALINDINNQRRAEYARVAAENNLQLGVVGSMMFEKIYTRLPAGTWVSIKGEWKKKTP